MRALPCRLAVTLLAMVLAAAAHAQEQRFDIGIHVGVSAADGEPANDIPGAGIAAHYAIDDVWTLGAAIDRTRYDFEEPARIVGIVQDQTHEAVDALAEATTVSVSIERSLTERIRPTSFFVGAGLRAAFTDVPDASGPRADGGRFDIHTEVDTEIIASVLGGVRRRFGERWYGEIGVHVDQHFTEWRSVDRITGAHGIIDDYLTWGIHFGVGVRW